MEIEEAIESGQQALTDALDEWKPNAIFAGFSGGSDSLMTTHLLHELRDDVAALHINTGIGMKRTRRFVRETAEAQGWHLEEYHPHDGTGASYDEIVRGETSLPGGFPGPAMHKYMYINLKQRPLEQVHRDFKGRRGGKIALVAGIRADESQIRAGYADSVVECKGGVVWINLIYHVTERQKQTYIDTVGLETNPVSDVYGMSGECLCGAYDTCGGRRYELQSACERFGEPETWNRIVSLHDQVKDRFPWHWDEARPGWFSDAKKGQLMLDGLPDTAVANRTARMCVGCGKT